MFVYQRLSGENTIITISRYSYVNLVLKRQTWPQLRENYQLRDLKVTQTFWMKQQQSHIFKGIISIW
jgi:hypothetical protein